MKIYQDWHGLGQFHQNLVLGLGNFDGLHLGHRRLIASLVNKAEETGGTAAVFTFYPHPLAVLRPGQAPPLLMTREIKQEMLAVLGVKVLLEVPFTSQFAAIEPQEFVTGVLVRELAVQHVFAGYNYTFGQGGRGDAQLLQAAGRQHGFGVHIVPPVMVDDVPVSSTLVRQLLTDGEVEAAARYLGYSPFLEGRVVAGEQRGRLLGFPTANIELPAGLLVPANGVYAVKIRLGKEIYPGVANIGTKPTFHAAGSERTFEVHILDFAGDIYGERVRVFFRRRLRGEQRFASVDQLVEQIHRDIALTRELSGHNFQREVI
ncbi:bifunctional riboflavin kinase/FAD synthetase [Desulfurispora thermophila]|uniref:bifunctional riboflavin kinase/FAD synthetase n=1 Tax=Desulfurispora thermophila TaxID=265470 RepID=UPI00037A1FA8|nr:bifunctional riboflavin kinase/FAD synthetase [Desulfurispora thermophila]